MPGFPMVDMYIKNETDSISGTLKHRFVWALILWAVTEGKVLLKDERGEVYRIQSRSNQILPYMILLLETLELVKHTCVISLD